MCSYAPGDKPPDERKTSLPLTPSPLIALPFTPTYSRSCVYLEHNPLAKDFEYRMRLLKMFPTLTQIDAVPIPVSR